MAGWGGSGSYPNQGYGQQQGQNQQGYSAPAQQVVVPFRHFMVDGAVFILVAIFTRPGAGIHSHGQHASCRADHTKTRFIVLSSCEAISPFHTFT